MEHHTAQPFLNFESANGEITCNSVPIHIKGINWFGMETNVFLPHALWQASFDSLFKHVTDNGFNAVRLPLSLEAVEKMETQTAGPMGNGINTSLNPDWANITIATCIDRFIARCGHAGILVMLDMHLLKASTDITPLWYAGEFTEQRLINGWKALLARFQRHWNFFACDLKNEPHGQATWGDGGPTDWRAAAERIGNAILAVAPRMLIFVEGIEGQGQQCWWGGFLGHAAKHPVRLTNPKRLVYSPHVYGPDGYPQEYFSAHDFPHNMPAVWKRHWAHLLDNKQGPAVVLGEWGGYARPGSPDLILQRALAEFLNHHGLSSFYWCLNPNSDKTGGTLETDWATPVPRKLELIHTACPAPTSFAGRKPHPTKKARSALPWDPILKLGPGVPPPKVEDPTAPVVTNGGSTKTDGATVTLITKPNHSWQDETGDVTQWDVALKNNTGVALTSTIRLVVKGADVVNIWNMALVGAGVYQLPIWLTANGGLQPGATHTFGVITHQGHPDFAVDNNGH